MLAEIDEFRHFLQVTRRHSEHTLKGNSEDLPQPAVFLDRQSAAPSAWADVRRWHLRAFPLHLTGAHCVARRTTARNLAAKRSFFRVTPRIYPYSSAAR